MKFKNLLTVFPLCIINHAQARGIWGEHTNEGVTGNSINLSCILNVNGVFNTNYLAGSTRLGIAVFINLKKALDILNGVKSLEKIQQ